MSSKKPNRKPNRFLKPRMFDFSLKEAKLQFYQPLKGWEEARIWQFHIPIS